MKNIRFLESDGRLLSSVKNGDIKAFAEMFVKNRPSLLAHAIFLLGYTPQAEDAVSDTFIIAITRLSTLRKSEAINSWLHAILKNVCRRYWREANRVFPLTQDLSDQLKSTSKEPEEVLEESIANGYLWKAIDSLSDPLKTALMLRYYTDFYSYDEISLILGIPQGTVKSRLSDAKSKLKSLMHQYSGDSYNDIAKVYLKRADYHKFMWQKFYQDTSYLRKYFSSNLQVFFPQENISGGLSDWIFDMESDIRAESIFHPESTTTSRTISIIEGKITNAPKTPNRCPDRALAILYHSEQKIERMYIYTK